jgi:hypothetical protein
MATQYDSTVTVRMKPEVRALFDELMSCLKVKSLRAIQEEMIGGYLATASYALHQKAIDLDAEIAGRVKIAESITARLPSATEDDARSLELEAASNNVFLGMAQSNAEIVKRLLEIFGDVINEANSITDIPTVKVPDLNIKQSVIRLADSMISKYRLNTDPCYRRNMEANGLLQKEDMDE